MALVLRKTVLSKNVSLLKCMKGRTLATAAKKNPAPLSSAVACRSKREGKGKSLRYVKIQARRLTTPRGHTKDVRMAPLKYAVSCPNVIEARIKNFVSSKYLTQANASNTFSKCSAYPYYPVLLRSRSLHVVTKRNYSKPCSCGCPCPFPCGPCGGSSGCGCLPPPCNTPPRCIQYMSGYYYYPYGVWFCGPYHVAGTCCPVNPNGPCSPCGPCPPCGPCSPCGPCPACGPCPKCPCPPAPACVCPTPPISTPCGPNSPLKTNPNIVPASHSSFTSRDTSKSGISKFFPFSTAANPTLGGSASSESKKPRPPTISSYGTRKDYYSTQATGTAYGQNVHNLTKLSKISGEPSKPVRKLSSAAFAKSMSDYTARKNKPCIYHRRYRKCVSDACPILEKPRSIETQEQRDRPRVIPGSFNYSSVPSYKNPYPRPYSTDFKPYDY